MTNTRVTEDTYQSIVDFDPSRVLFRQSQQTIRPRHRDIQGNLEFPCHCASVLRTIYRMDREGDEWFERGEARVIDGAPAHRPIDQARAESDAGTPLRL